MTAIENQKVLREPIAVTKASSVNVTARTLEAVVSDDSLDRDGEIVEPRAFKKRLATFQKNPVLLWSHDPFQPPIGKAINIRFEPNTRPKRMEMTFEFAKEGTSELSDQVFKLYQQGILTSFSVGFRVFKTAEARFDGQGNQIAPPRITDAELFEVSAVTIPANVNAVVKACGTLQLAANALPQAVAGPTTAARMSAGADALSDVLDRLHADQQVTVDERYAARRLILATIPLKCSLDEKQLVDRGLAEVNEKLKIWLRKARA